MTRKLLRDAGTHALLLMLLLIAAVLAFYLLLPHSPVETVEARPAEYLSSVGESAASASGLITFNVPARLSFTHSPKYVRVSNTTGGSALLKFNQITSVITPNVSITDCHVIVPNNTIFKIDGWLQVNSIDLFLYHASYTTTEPITGGTFVAAGWW